MAKAKYIDAVLRFRDEFSGKMDVSIKKIKEQNKWAKNLGNSYIKTGKNLTSAGKTMTKGVTSPLLAIGVASVKTAADFEAGMSNVQAIAGATADEMTLLKDKAKEMGAKTKFSASESADAFSYMATAGWETSEMLDGIEGIMYLAGATGEDLAQTSDIVTDSLTAFGLKASDTNHFVDVLAETANATNTGVSEMGETFKYVAPVAGALGYSIEDTSVAIGVMANSGIKASNAGTALRSLFTNLAKPTDAMQGAMDKLGISLTDSSGNMKSLDEVMGDLRKGFSGLSEAEKANYAATIAGKTGMSGLLAIVNATDEDFDSVTKSIGNCTGAAKEMYDVANDNLSGSLTILKSTIESIAISIGDKLSPYIRDVTDFVQKLADKFNGLSDEQLGVIIKLAGVAAAIGPVLLVMGKAYTTVGKLYKSGKKIVKGIQKFKSVYDAASTVFMVMTNGVSVKAMIIIGIIAAIAVAAILIYKNWDKIKPLFEKIGEAFKKLGEGFKVVGERIKSDWNDLKETWQGFCDKVKGKCDEIKSKWEDFKNKTTTIFTAVKMVIETWVNSVRGKFDLFKSKVESVILKVKDKFESFVKHIKKIKIEVAIFVTSLILKFREFKEGLSEKINAIKGKITEWKEHCKEQFEAFKSAINGVVNKVKDFAEKIISKFNTVKTTIGNIIGSIRTKIDSITGTLNRIIKFVTSTFTTAWRKAWQGVKDIFTGIFSTLSSALKAPLNAVIGLINGAIGKINSISFTVPDWVPGLGGKTFGASLKTIPYLYKGTNFFEGGTAVIHDRGGEIVDLPRGTRVLPHDKSVSEAYKMGQSQGGGNKNITIAKLADTIVVREESDIDKIAEKLAEKIKETDDNFAA